MDKNILVLYFLVFLLSVSLGYMILTAKAYNDSIFGFIEGERTWNSDSYNDILSIKDDIEKINGEIKYMSTSMLRDALTSWVRYLNRTDIDRLSKISIEKNLTCLFEAYDYSYTIDRFTLHFMINNTYRRVYLTPEDIKCASDFDEIDCKDFCVF